MAIKVVALDIYGTVLATEDPENSLPPREGLDDFFNNCDNRNIKVVSASDGVIDNVRIDLEVSGVDLGRFAGFFKLDQLPVKDYSIVIGHYDILPREFLVVGDSYKDIGGAIKYGTLFLRVPEYHDRQNYRDFNFREIELDSVH